MSKQAKKQVKSTVSTKELSIKKQILEDASLVLKKEFVGIDSIIDEVIHSIEAWYMYPQGQIRPTVINLWGMTGVGKTSLVSRLSELINVSDKLYRFDIGDYSSGDMRLRSDFSDKLKSNEKQPIVLMFDEFQLGRTISDSGSEVDRNGLRALWDLLDTGKISLINENYYSGKIISLMMKLQHCIDSGVESSNGKITKNKKLHTDLFYSRTNNKKVLEDENGDKVDASLFVPNEYLYYLKNLSSNPYLDTENSILSNLMKMSHKQVLEFLKDTLSKHLKPVVRDFSQSLIFVIGNLDEVYSMSGVIDPDYDADIFYKNSLNITTPKVKEALKHRFRVEQIARLGNNHILYPAFSSESYQKLIDMELDKFKLRAEKRYGISIEFDQSVHSIIYREGVFPTQGTRPIFTTMNTLIESYVSKIVLDILLNDLNVDKIIWSFIEESGEYEVRMNSNGKLYKKRYSTKLKLDDLRKSTKDDAQAHTAVHEAGHAVVACMNMGLVPEEIVSKTASNKAGYCRVKMPDIVTKETIKKDITIGLGGYIAEKLIFGEELLSTGSYMDIEMVTEKAISYVKTYGMTGMPILVGLESDKMNETHHFEHASSDKEIKKLVESCLKNAERTIKKNKRLLLKLAEYLSENSRMNQELIHEFVKKYGVNTPKIKESENYYEFKNILKEQLKKI
jgi:cell division protease FtsH